MFSVRLTEPILRVKQESMRKIILKKAQHFWLCDNEMQRNVLI